MCVSVKYRRPNRWTDQIRHAYADGPGDGSYLKKLTSPPKGGVEVGILGGKKIKSPGNVMNCINNFFLTHPTPGAPGGGGVGGQHFKSPVNFMNCRENR